MKVNKKHVKTAVNLMVGYAVGTAISSGIRIAKNKINSKKEA